MTVDGAALRARWDATCDVTVRELEAARRTAEAEGPAYLVEVLTRSISAVRLLHGAVDARRRPPKSGIASGLWHDMPQDFNDPPYRRAGDALLELSRFYEGGMDVDWDWSRGFPPGWPSSWGERLLGGRIVRVR